MAAEAQLEMLAALQPFVDGAIAKTIDLPAECTLDMRFPSKARRGAVLTG